MDVDLVDQSEFIVSRLQGNRTCNALELLQLLKLDAGVGEALVPLAAEARIERPDPPPATNRDGKCRLSHLQGGRWGPSATLEREFGTGSPSR